MDALKEVSESKRYGFYQGQKFGYKSLKLPEPRLSAVARPSSLDEVEYIAGFACGYEKVFALSKEGLS